MRETAWREDTTRRRINLSMTSHRCTFSSMTPQETVSALAAWRRRKSSMPTIPGGRGSHISVLRTALEAIAETPDRDALVPWPSSEVQASVATVADQIAPAGLLKRLAGGKVELTDQARQWLADPDSSLLITIFHENIRFVGELLAELRTGGLTHEEIRVIAVQKYRLGWNSPDQINRRCAWLQATGMAELQYDHNVALTDNGRSLLTGLSPMDPVALEFSDVDVEPASLPVADSRIQAVIDGLTDEKLRARSAPALYIPKGPASVYDSITSLRVQLDSIGPRMTKADYLRLCATEFDNKESSAKSALDTLRHAGLVRQTGFSTFDTTDVAHAWLESGEDLELVRIFHANIRCMAELITLLDEATSVARLIEAANNRYGIKLNVMALRQRLQILRECGLVDQATAMTYLATSRGRALASTLPLETPIPEDDQVVAQVQNPTPANGTRVLAEELYSTARDPKQPRRFEEAVAAAFRRLGLSAEHLGGSGVTDVLVTIHRNPTSEVKIIVDAKATGHTSVLESAVDFTTLEEHRKQHGASHVALVAIGFEAGRIIKRARDNNVSLISVDDLVAVLDRHGTAPLTPLELLALFDSHQKERLWVEADRRNSLMAAATRAIAEEAEYVEESGESFSVKDIHKSVRREIDPPPSMDEIQAILDLLASPLIEGVNRDGKGYQPGITAEGIAARLRALANAVVG